MLNEVLHLTNGAPFAQGHENVEIPNNADERYEEFVNSAAEVIYKTYGFFRPFFKDDLKIVNQLKNTSCFGCKYDDCEVDEEERKANCLFCLEFVTIRKNFVGRENDLHVKDK